MNSFDSDHRIPQYRKRRGPDPGGPLGCNEIKNYSGNFFNHTPPFSSCFCTVVLYNLQKFRISCLLIERTKQTNNIDVILFPHSLEYYGKISEFYREITIVITIAIY